MFYKGYEYQIIIKALKFKALQSKWSGRQDLNLQPLGPKPSALPSWATSRYGALEGIRTPDLLVRSQTLYPAELRAHDPTNTRSTFVSFKLWWLQRESNQRHEDFQSSALPTELWSQIWRSQRDSNPRSSAWQADVLTSCTMRPNIWLREQDLNLWPLGYEPNELPSCSIPRYNVAEEKGFEPLRRLHDLPVFKTGPFNQTWVFLRMVPKAGLEPARVLKLAGF